jgi:hypothetical protein
MCVSILLVLNENDYDVCKDKQSQDGEPLIESPAKARDAVDFHAFASSAYADSIRLLVCAQKREGSSQFTSQPTTRHPSFTPWRILQMTDRKFSLTASNDKASPSSAMKKSG